MGAKIQINHDSVYNFPTRRMFDPDPADVPCRAVGLDFPTQRMFGYVPLVWICNPDPLSIRIFNPPGSNELNQNSACGNKTATSSLSY